MNANIKRLNPYVGPRPFKTGETLYGRDGELHDLSNLLIAGRIVLLYSPSGAGKSSLVQAGLIPGLLARGLFVHPTIRLSLDIPERVAQGGTQTNRYLLSALLSLEGALEGEKRLSLEELPGLALDEYLGATRERRLAENSASQASPEERVEFGEVLIFDQFEEVLTLDPTDQASKEAFFQQVGEALRDRKRWALFVLREDFLAALDPYLLAIPTRFSSTFRLDFLGAVAARQAIQEPAKSTGVEFADQAAGKLVDDLRRVKVQQPGGTLEEQLGPYIEPVQLQVVCSNLWDKLEPGSQAISLSDLAEVGDVDQSLGEYYASKVRAVALSTQVPERAIREWFENDLITEQGFRGQVLMGQEQSEGLDNRVIHALVDTHLVRAEKRRGLTWYELTHDRLIGPLRKDNQRWFEANLSLLQRQASLWERNRQADHLLLRDEKLKEAKTWAASHESELTPDDRDFLKACQESQRLHDQSVELEIEKQRSEERARQASNLRRLLIIAVAAAILSVFLAITAFFARQDAISAQRTAVIAQNTAVYNENLANLESTNANLAAVTANISASQAAVDRKTAEAASTLAIQQKSTADFYATQANIDAARQVGEAGGRLLAIQALNNLDNRPDVSSLLAIEAYRTAPLWEAKNVLLSNIQRSLEQSVEPFGTPIPPQDYDIYRVALSPDGVHLAWGDYHGDVVLWNYKTGMEEKRFRPHTLDVRGLAFSPDGSLLASSGKDGRIILTNVASGESEQLMLSLDWAFSVTFNPKDGTKLAAGVGKDLVIWDLTTREYITLPSETPKFLFSVAWSPDGKKLAASSYGGEIRIWDPSTKSGYYLQKEFQSTVHSLDWSPDGRWLASAHQDGRLILWDMINNRQQVVLESPHAKEAVYSLSFSSDGNLLASGGGDNSIAIWKVPSMELFKRLSVHNNRVDAVEFIPENKLGQWLLASGSFDNQVKLFEISSQQPLSSQVADDTGEAMIALAASGDAQAMRSASLKGGKLLVTGLVQPLGENVTSAAFNSQGSMLGVGQADGRILLFDPGSGELIRILEGGQKAILSLAFNAQGNMLASGLCENEVAQAGTRPTCAESVIQVWDPESGQALLSFTANVDYLRALAFYPIGDATFLAAGSYDGTIQIWNPYTRSLKPEGRSLTRFPSGVISLAFSPDGRTLASGRTDGTLILWDSANIDTTNPQPLGDPLRGSPSSIRSLTFSSDGQTLFSGNEIGGVLAWDVSLKSWIERNCALAKRNLSEDEWAQFLPNKPYPSSVEAMTCPKNK
jgi:WD40 repeat protein